MATYPARLSGLQRVVDSVLPQCDILRIYMNEFEEIPEFLKHPKIEIAIGLENIKDTGKFYWANTWKAEYYFTIDDDIIYPPFFAANTIKAMKAHNVNVCTIHGRIMKPTAVDITPDNITAFYPCKVPQKESFFVNYAGTGACCFDNSRLIIHRDIFETHGMTDQYFAIAMQELQEPILCREHSAVGLINYDTTLWGDRDIKSIQLNNKVLGSVKWKIYKPTIKTYVLSPAYKNTEYLEEFIQSLQGQHCHILIGVDGCPKTLKKAKELKKKYNFELYYYPENKGAFITLNSLMKHVPSNGTIITAGSDDVMHPDFVEKMTQNKPCYSKYTGVICFDKSLLQKLGGYVSWRYGADTELATRLKRVTAIKAIEQLYHYRQHSGQLTKKNSNRDKEWHYIRTVSKNGAKKIKPEYQNNEEYVR
jgi:hypothetical protein